MKERRLGSTHEMNKITNNQKRSTIFVQEDRTKLSDLNEDSPKKSFHVSISNNKNNILEKFSEKRKITSEEQLKVPNNNININKNDKIKGIKDRREEEKKIEKEKKRIEEEKRKREEEMRILWEKIKEEEDARRIYELQKQEEIKRREDEMKRIEEERKQREFKRKRK